MHGDINHVLDSVQFQSIRVGIACVVQSVIEVKSPTLAFLGVSTEYGLEESVLVLSLGVLLQLCVGTDRAQKS